MILPIIICSLASVGAKYHDKKSNKTKPGEPKHLYHIQMMVFYTAILDASIQASKYQEQQIKRKLEEK